MDKYVVRQKYRFTGFIGHLITKLLQRPDFYPIRHYERLRRDRSPWLTH
jgi:hypothetical protein